jgi:carboxylate-amine ligase
MVVDRSTLNILPIADQLLKDFAGEFIGEVERGDVTLNNELALHVIEFKTSKPAPSIDPLPNLFQNEIKEVIKGLKKYNATLMPSAMHPWMDPHQEFKIWPHDNSIIYDTFDKIFHCKGHGWANLQSTHLNLPFSGDSEFARLHSSIRLLLPLIPAMAASSPFADGKATGIKDFRIDTYKKNAQKMFSVTGHVIPEVCLSKAEYEKNILNPLYKDLAPYDPQGVLRFEWANARGAIARFERNSIEVRLVDIQECPVADCAIVSLFTSLLKELCSERWNSIEQYNSLSCEQLLAILNEVYVKGEEAIISDHRYLEMFGWNSSKTPSAKILWEHIISSLSGQNSIPAHFSAPLSHILSHGTLSTRIVKSVGNSVNQSALHATYQELVQCLEKGILFRP